MKNEFSTENLHSRYRFDAWRDAICTRLIRAEARQTAKDDFSGSFSYSALNELEIATHTSHSSLIWQRTGNCIRHHPNHDFYLGVVKSGQGRLAQNGHCTLVSAGDVVIYDADAPFDFAMDRMTIDIVHLPRKRMESEAPGIRTLAGQRFDLTRPGIVSLKQMLAEAYLFNASQEQSCLTEQFANTLFSVISVGINLQQSHFSAKTDLYQRIVSYLRQNLHHHQLSVSTIANAHHISPRTVSRIFAAHDTTPMNFVWQERLAACRRILSEGKARSVTQVALDHGFSDMSHFSLAFRKAYGCAPGSLITQGKLSVGDE